MRQDTSAFAASDPLRVQMMHAGYPMIDAMLTLLQANSHVSRPRSTMPT